jgi:hypothetical protein
MSLGFTLLDELDYVQAPLPHASQTQGKTPIALEQSFAVSGSSQKLTLRSPYFTRALGPADLGGAWEPFGRELRQRGISIFSPVDALGNVPVASLPSRWSARAVDEPFDATELATADLFEVTCHDRARQDWRWPDEISDERIDGLLRTVRTAAGGNTPIGLSLPLGCHPIDLRRSLTADVDFISLSSRFAKFEASDLHSIVLCRELAGQLNRPQLPLLVTAPIVDMEQAHKLLALGASAVSLDDILRPAIAQDLRLSDEELSIVDLRRKLPSIALSLNPKANKILEIPRVSQLLEQIQRLLRERLRSVGANNLSMFTPQCMRSVSERAERVTRVARMGHIGQPLP